MLVNVRLSLARKKATRKVNVYFKLLFSLTVFTSYTLGHYFFNSSRNLFHATRGHR